MENKTNTEIAVTEEVKVAPKTKVAKTRKVEPDMGETVDINSNLEFVYYPRLNVNTKEDVSTNKDSHIINVTAKWQDKGLHIKKGINRKVPKVLLEANPFKRLVELEKIQVIAKG